MFKHAIDTHYSSHRSTFSGYAFLVYVNNGFLFEHRTTVCVDVYVAKYSCEAGLLIE